MSSNPKSLSFQDYAVRAAKTARYPSRGSGSLVYPVLGLTGEAGEVAEKVKKIIRDRDGVVGDQRDELVKELGDVLWYLAACCHELDVPLELIASVNLAKLESRAQRGVLGGDGDNR